MEYIDFVHKVRAAIPVGTILKNPGGGTSEILSLTPECVKYRRGNSSITVHFRDLFDAFTHFGSGKISSTDLKEFKPSVFDSSARPAGHSCNCTFLFMVLQQIGLVDQIHGNGVSGDPFYVDLF